MSTEGKEDWSTRLRLQPIHQLATIALVVMVPLLGYFASNAYDDLKKSIDGIAADNKTMFFQLGQTKQDVAVNSTNIIGLDRRVTSLEEARDRSVESWGPHRMDRKQ